MSEWKTVPLRALIKPNNQRNRPDLQLLSVVRERGVIVRSLDKSDNHNTIPEDLSGYKVVHAGQFVMNKMKAWQGSCGVSRFDGIVSPAYFVFDLKGTDPYFFNYTIRSRHYVDEFGRISSGIRVGQWDLSLDKLKYIPFPLPPREEQDQIVRFLDWKVSQTNRLINAKKKQIALLQEQKRALISSRLFGAKTWLKRLLTTPFQYGANDSGCDYRKELPRYIRITDISLDGKLKTDGAKSIDEQIAKPYLLEDGDVLLARSGATAGKTFLYKAEYGLSAYAGYLIRAKLNTTKILPQYLMYFTNSYDYEKWKNSIFIQATIQNISAERYGQLPIPLPSINEQKKIISDLDKLCANIDTLNDRIQSQISLLHEFRTSLISDVVTGKMDVRGIKIPQYEAVEDSGETDNVDDIEYGVEEDMAE